MFGNTIEGGTIPMTAPVLFSGGREEDLTLSFVMPEGTTLDTLPVPEDTEIEIRSVGRLRAAVPEMPMHPSERNVDAARRRPVQALRRYGTSGELDVRTAYHNPPWTIPFMRRTEVIAWLPGGGDGQ